MIRVLSFCLCCLPLANAVAHGDLHERVAQVSAKIQSNLTDPALWLLRAELYRLHGKYAHAHADLDRATRLKADLAAVSLVRAQIYFDAGDFLLAEIAASRCLKLRPSLTEPRVLRARSRVKSNRIRPALADYNVVLSTTNDNPPLPELYVERARAQAALKRYAEAIEGLDAGMKRIGDTPSLALPAIQYERARGAYNAALSRLEAARQFMSREDYSATRGEILLQAHRFAEAQETFESGLGLLTDTLPARRMLSQTSDIEKRLRLGLTQTGKPLISLNK